MLASSEAAIELPRDVDLHARPAADFVRTAMRFDATIAVTAPAGRADAKSLLSVLALGAKGGSRLVLSAEGADAADAVAALAGCVAELHD